MNNRVLSGVPWVWVCAGALITIVALIVFLFSLIISNGVLALWPRTIYSVTQPDGKVIQALYHRHSDAAGEAPQEIFFAANQDFGTPEFIYLPESDSNFKTEKQEFWFVERKYWGAFIGTLKTQNGKVIETTTELETLSTTYSDTTLQLVDSVGTEKTIKMDDIERAFLPNQLNIFSKFRIFGERLWMLLSEAPREANTAGGVAPAIFGTVIMTLIMSICVVPVGVLTALYLREIAKQGLLVRLVRIAVGNLAGVPSIVYGIFGLGFFCYTLGYNIDVLFFAEKLPSPTFGTGGILWASLTLAMLTVPVVIISTEEALSSVPRSLREASYGCGATRLQTLVRVVLPRAMPGVLTGLILAMARGVGEVAPLLMTGVVKMAPSMPIDGVFPYLHLERSFMHLGFHIYDLGFQSRSAEVTRYMVFACTLLLVTIVFFLNFAAIKLRTHMREKFEGRGAF